MSAALDIDPGERGRMRLFTVDLDEAALRDLIASGQPADTDPERPFVAAAPALLGLPRLDLPHVELFDVADLAGLGLPAYLATAHDISEAQIAPLRARLDGLEGFVLLLLSEALSAPDPLSPDPALRLVATFDTPQAEISMQRLTSETGRGSLAPPALDPAPEGRPAPRGALILAALVATILVLWAASALVR